MTENKFDLVNVETEREFCEEPPFIFARMVRSDNVYPPPVVKVCFLFESSMHGFKIEGCIILVG